MGDGGRVEDGVEHEARAWVGPSWARRGRPSFEGLAERMRPAGARRLTAPVAVLLRRLGLDLVERRGVEELEALARRGVIAGGSDLSDYLETAVVGHVFRNTAIFSTPSNVYVALFTSATTDGGGGTEVADANGYARVAVATASGWTGAGGSTDNAADIDFGAASGGDWGTVTHVAVTDSATHGAGNFYVHGSLAAAKTVQDGDSFKFAAGDLDVSLD